MSKRAIGWLYFIGMILEIISVVLFLGFQAQYRDDSSLMNGYINCTSDSGFHSGGCYSYSSQDAYQQAANAEGQHVNTDETVMVFCVFGMIISGLLGLGAWIGALVNFSRGQQWAWFVLTFFFGGILIFIYLVGGPAVPKAGQVQQGTVLSSPGEHPLPPPAYQQAGPQVYQPQPSALEVLQLRLARGEIDEQTYQRLRETLKA